MPIDVTCPECASVQTVGNDKAGLRLRCPGCGVVISIPAVTSASLNQGEQPSNDGRKTARRRSPLTSLLRPMIYGVFITFAISALLFRWLFNHPPEPKPTVNIAQNEAAIMPVLPSPVGLPSPRNEESSVELSPSNKPTEQVMPVLNEALAELVQNGATSRFNSLLQSIAEDLPELTLSTEPEKVVWNKTTLFEHGLLLNAFRFTSPLDVDGDLFWCIASPGNVGNWHILPATGSMHGFSSFKVLNHIELEGLDLSNTTQVFTQLLLDGQIRAGQSYIVYFNSNLNNPTPLRMAARVLPTKPYHDREDRPSRIFRQLGITKLPKLVPTPESRVLTGHTNYISHLAWKPDGELLSFDVDGDIYTWDAAATEPKAKFSTGLEIDSAAVSADGRRAVLLGNRLQHVTLWDLESNQALLDFPVGEATPSYACFSLDGLSAYVLYHRRSAQLPGKIDLIQWSTEDGSRLAGRKGDEFGCRGLQLTPRGPRLLGFMSPSRTQTDAAHADYLADLSEPPKIVSTKGYINLAACRVQAGARDLFADFYGYIKLMDPDSDGFEYQGSAMPFYLSNACSLADDRFAALATHDGSIHLFDTVERQVCMSWIGHTDTILQVRVSPNGRTLASSSKDGTIRLWNTAQRSHPELEAQTLVDSQGHELKPIPSGEFFMGSSDTFAYRSNAEQPQHRVRISQPFWMGAREITVAQFRNFVEATGYVTTVEKNKLGGKHLFQRGFVQKPEYTWRNPGYESADQFPVVHVTWEDAHAYCKWLSEVEHATYRLPTEAEWEYACGADSVTQHAFSGVSRSIELCVNCADASLQAVFENNYQEAGAWNDGHAFAAPVGTYLPNKFGLSEILGNVWELCEDTWRDRYDELPAGDRPIIDPVKRGNGPFACRGGSFAYGLQHARACRRDNMKSDEAKSDVGFRVVREIPR